MEGKLRCAERVRKAGMICQDLGHKYGKRPRRGASTAKPLHRKAFELFFGATELGVGNRKVTLVDVGSTRSRRRASVPQKTGTERCPLVTRHPPPWGTPLLQTKDQHALYSTSSARMMMWRYLRSQVSFRSLTRAPGPPTVLRYLGTPRWVAQDMHQRTTYRSGHLGLSWLVTFSSVVVQMTW